MTIDMPRTMKAVRIHANGGPETLMYEDAPVPEPGPDELLIRVHAAGVNPADWKTRRGPGVGGPPSFPLILGWDVAGVIEALDPAVKTMRPGDAVYGMIRFPRPGAAYAEYATAPAADVARKPATLDFVAAAALPLATLTAWQALFEVAGLRAGETLLVNGASGGVGHLAVQIAAAKGARVLGTTSARNASFVHGLGADVIDYTAPDAFAHYTNGVDVVFDTVGGDAGNRLLPVLRRGGRYVTIARGMPPDGAADAAGVAARRYLVHPDGAQLAEIARLVDEGKVRPHVEAALPLAEARRAHELSEGGHVRGKIVLVCA